MRLKLQLLAPALALLCWQGCALAALGGDVRSVNADRALMHGQLQSTPMQQYDLHAITTSGGTLVHEYMTPQGQVFAVTWRGPFPPNLQHRMFSVTQPDFVMQALGRMRAYHGKAYIPSLVPSGVSVAALP